MNDIPGSALQSLPQIEHASRTTFENTSISNLRDTIAPLYNQRGKTEFFIGGQVNCSTTIHSNVDVLKVLSTSATNDADIAELNNKPLPGNPQSTRPSARKTILKALGVRQNGHNVHVPQMDAGMENGVLGRMEGQDLNAQMKEFYTAYSKVSKSSHCEPPPLGPRPVRSN